MISRILPVYHSHAFITSSREDLMSDAVTIRNYHVIIDAPVETVYDFVADLSTLPDWAYHFCQSARLVDTGAIITTPRGEQYFGITGDRDLGVLDWWAGPTMETATRWPTRLVALPGERSLYTVTAIFGASVSPDLDGHFADELGALKRLVESAAVSAPAIAR
jgi:hypothetical protein